MVPSILSRRRPKQTVLPANISKMKETKVIQKAVGWVSGMWMFKFWGTQTWSSLGGEGGTGKLTHLVLHIREKRDIDCEGDECEDCSKESTQGCKKPEGHVGE